jgi:hypothetical protein
LLIGGSSYLLLNQLNLSKSHINICEAEPKLDGELSKRLSYAITDNHLKLDPKRQTLFVFYDPKNPLHNEYLTEVETK